MADRHALLEDGTRVTLRRLYPAMVTTTGKRHCRTLYEDEGGTMWCVWYGAYHMVSKRRLEDYPRVGEHRDVYVVDEDVLCHMEE